MLVRMVVTCSVFHITYFETSPAKWYGCDLDIFSIFISCHHDMHMPKLSAGAYS